MSGVWEDAGKYFGGCSVADPVRVTAPGYLQFYLCLKRSLRQVGVCVRASVYPLAVVFVPLPEACAETSWRVCTSMCVST